ncbi:hypothetical protein AMJ57_00465 [Parcubacteria bacterium SG8_24]|nr:MAG: hypothetical protein AMJ57_00465 [Parcubacteria bacterium SG8_24]
MAQDKDQDRIEHLLRRRVVEVIGEDSLRQRLASGKPLRIKLGFDPTAPDIHLGHTLTLKKIKEFQDLGHQIVFIVGDYTARVGDPTGKSRTRPMLTEDEVKDNAATYLAQIGKILDVDKAEVRHNSEWFSRMAFADIISLTSKFTVARMIERDDFENRLNEGIDIHMHELLYPMMQAYDSVMVEADVEMGSTDQRFNILAGRELQRKMGHEPQDVMLIGPILVGTDGVRKMSKSLDNYIGIDEPPEEIYGKVMSIPDAVLWDYYLLVTDVDEVEIDNMRDRCGRGEMNPRDAKARLAAEIVTAYHSEEAARQAEGHFRKVFREKGVPDEVPETATAGGVRPVIELLVESGLAGSKSEARRLIAQKGIRVEGEIVDDEAATVEVSAAGRLIQKGKRHFVRVKAK